MITSHYCESATEKIACIKRELDSRILAYQTQPFSVLYVFNGQRRRYTPDAMVFWSDGRVTFEEVKPENWAHGSEFSESESCHLPIDDFHAARRNGEIDVLK